MTKFIKFTEALLLPLIAIISSLISLADLFDIFPLMPQADIPLLTLLIASMALGALSIIQYKYNEAHRDLQRLLSTIELEHMEKTIALIHPELLKVLSKDYFLSIRSCLQIAAEESKVSVNDHARFSFYFRQMLRCYPNETFLSTCSATTSYLWKDPEIKKALSDFIAAGGTIKQIFFARSHEELFSQEVEAIAAQLRSIGIEARMATHASIPDDHKKYFFVEENGRVAWEAFVVDHEGHVGSSTLTANKQETANYCHIFENLWRSTHHLNGGS